VRKDRLRLRAGGVIILMQLSFKVTAIKALKLMNQAFVCRGPAFKHSRPIVAAIKFAWNPPDRNAYTSCETQCRDPPDYGKDKKITATETRHRQAHAHVVSKYKLPDISSVAGHSSSLDGLEQGPRLELQDSFWSQPRLGNHLLPQPRAEQTSRHLIELRIHLPLLLVTGHHPLAVGLLNEAGRGQRIPARMALLCAAETVTFTYTPDLGNLARMPPGAGQAPPRQAGVRGHRCRVPVPLPARLQEEG